MQQVYSKLPLLFLAIIITSTSLAGCKKKDMSLKLNEPRNIKGVISYRRTFGDLNEAHLNIAQAIGIAPIASRKDAENMKEKLHHIETNDLYKVDSLTHSIPYLIPSAAQLLDTIGSNFLDSLTAKGLNPNKVIVTSVLRTQDDVKRLRRRNGNASANSAHFYGTTFDVSWKRFQKRFREGFIFKTRRNHNEKKKFISSGHGWRTQCFHACRLWQLFNKRDTGSCRF